MSFKKPKYVLSNLIAIDQLANTLLWGYPDETLSARAYRMDGKKKRWTIARWVIDKIFFWDEDHCRNAFMAEVLMAQSSPHARESIRRIRFEE